MNESLTITYLRRSLVDASYPDSLAARLRAKRNAAFLARFPRFSEMRVIDLGGRPRFWRTLPVRPAEMVLLNTEDIGAPDEPWMRSVRGDACDPPETLGHFDLAFSNSTIEHVGGHAKRQQFASAVMSLADAYWIQTPCRSFPIEPHWYFPGFQFLPTRAKSLVGRHWYPARINYPGRGGELETVLEVELLSIVELQYYFPDAEVLRERFAGLTKSLIATSRGVK
jgi:hypothetical protein